MTALADSADPVLAGIAEVVRRHLDWHGPVRRDMRWLEDFHLDSVGLLTLAVEIENRFRVVLDEADESGIETVGDLAEVVRRKLG